jgi:hypothetical protein
MIEFFSYPVEVTCSLVSEHLTACLEAGTNIQVIIHPPIQNVKRGLAKRGYSICFWSGVLEPLHI